MIICHNKSSHFVRGLASSAPPAAPPGGHGATGQLRRAGGAEGARTCGTLDRPHSKATVFTELTNISVNKYIRS
jgi:hypothetical protein